MTKIERAARTIFLTVTISFVFTISYGVFKIVQLLTFGHLFGSGSSGLGASYSLAANPPGKESSESRTSKANSLTNTEKQTKPNAKSVVAKYKYVASKNSNIFHKPGCSWAKRIKPENLVGYNSKEEAIKAGKRPCKRCKP